MKRTKICPHCGESIPEAAIACTHCGSDDTTGWAAEEDIEYQSVEIPDTWSPESEAPDSRASALWKVVAVLLLVAFLLWLLAGAF